MRAAPLALAVLALATACSGKQEHRQASCAREARSAQSAPLRQALRGDVDGDGTADLVAVVSPRRARPACRFFVVVHSGAQSSASLVYDPMVLEAAPALAPALGLLAAVDRRPGLEIVIVTGHSASSTQFGIFTVRDSSVRRMKVPSSDGIRDFYDDQALTHFGTVDCVHTGGGVIAQVYGENLVSRSDRWSTEVWIYRTDDSNFRLISNRRFVARTPSHGSPFANCGGVHLQ